MENNGQMNSDTKLKLFIVGVGPGSSDYLTERAKNAIKSADIVIGWDMDLLPIKDLINDKDIYLQDVHNYKDVIKKVAYISKKERKSVAIARVGDPCISSGLKGILDIFDENSFDIEIIPGISSTQLAASKAKINIDDSVIISFHDYGDHEKEKQFMLEVFKSGKHLIVLTSPDLTPSGVADFLISNGCDPLTKAIVYSNLSLKDEKKEENTLKGFLGREFHWLSLMVVLNPSVPSEWESYLAWKKWREK